MYGIEVTLHHPDLRKKWSAVYMMNAMFLVIGRVELFGAKKAGFAIVQGALAALCQWLFREKRCDGYEISLAWPGMNWNRSRIPANMRPAAG